MTATSHRPETLLSLSPIAELDAEMRHVATEDGTLVFFG
jgi:hypothetical protein